MKKTAIEINLKNRIKTVQLPEGISTIAIKVSREKCNDILLELVDKNGKAKGKPLNKYLPMIKKINNIEQLRFMMNDFSTKPITVELEYRF